MKKETVIKCLNETGLDYTEKLQQFFCYYQSLVDKLYHQRVDDANSREDYIIKELIEWLEAEGYFLLYTTAEQLNEEIKDKVLGFIELYSFLLSHSEQDKLKLIDQLFFIPGQFAREFQVGQTYVGNNLNLCAGRGKINVERYTFNTKGALEKVPCFFRRIAYEN